MPKIRKRSQGSDGYREPTLEQTLFLSIRDELQGSNHATWKDWVRTREEKIKRCIEECRSGHRPFAFGVWDHPEVYEQQKPREFDGRLHYRFGLLPKDEERVLRSFSHPQPYERTKDKPGELVEFPEGTLKRRPYDR